MNPSSNSMEVFNPPNETFESEVSFYETQASYSEYAYILPKIQEVIDENQNLKSIIIKHSEEFAKKIAYMQQWKSTWTSKMKNVAVVKSHIKEKVLSLQTCNTKYELQFKENSQSKENSISENQCGEELRKKYLNTLLKLEKELKENKENKKILENSEFLIKNKVSQLENDQIQLQRCIEEERRRFQLLSQNATDLHYGKESAEAKCKEMKIQIISLFKERKLFQEEISELKKVKEEMSIRFNEIETEKHQYHEMYESVNQEKLQLMNTQEINVSEVTHLRTKLDEKKKAIDELYNELNKCQQPQQDGNVDNLLARLIAADESMMKKNGELKDIAAKMKELELRYTKSEENVQFFREQAEVYKQDFLIERNDRTQQNANVHQLKSALSEKDHQIEQFRRQIDQLNYDAILRNPQNNNR